MLPDLTIVQPQNNAQKRVEESFVVRVDQETDGTPGQGFAHLQYATQGTSGPWLLAALIGGGGVCESTTQPWSNQWSFFSLIARIREDCWIRAGVWPTEAMGEGNEPTIAVSDVIFLNAVAIENEPVDP